MMLLVTATSLALMGSMAPNPALACPDGATVMTESLDSGRTATFCALATGVRQGDYVEFSTGGRQVIWGAFDAGHEHGVWTMEVEMERDRQIVFVMFDSGNDITEQVLSHLPPECAVWNEMTEVGRAGTLATLALLASKQLTGKPAKLIKDKARVAACFASGASDRNLTRTADCGNGTRFTDELIKTVTALAEECVLSVARQGPR